MIIYNSTIPLKIQLQENIQELESYKDVYNKKILEYDQGFNYISSLLGKENCKQMTDTLSKNSNEKVKAFSTQISKIDRNIESLKDLLGNIDNLSKIDILKSINKYNKKYNEIKRNITLNNSNSGLNAKTNYVIETKAQSLENTIVADEAKTLNSVVNNNETINNNIDSKKTNPIDNNVDSKMTSSMYDNPNNSEDVELESNDTLLISEILGTVILPYSRSEVLEILKDKNNNYQTVQEIISDKFTRPLSDYRFQFWARYNETKKLLTERQNCKLADAITLALEMTGKRYLHPAIISACRNLDELDVYLDCLEKNELDDFKIFKIKYELHPILVKQGKGSNSIVNLFKNFSRQKHSKTKEI